MSQKQSYHAILRRNSLLVHVYPNVGEICGYSFSTYEFKIMLSLRTYRFICFVFPFAFFLQIHMYLLHKFIIIVI